MGFVWAETARATWIFFQKFIVNNPSQSQALLQTILQTPSMTGLLAPNFSPNASPELFVNMYEDTLKVPSRQGVEVAFTLLSKVTKIFYFEWTKFSYWPTGYEVSEDVCLLHSKAFVTASIMLLMAEILVLACWGLTSLDVDIVSLGRSANIISIVIFPDHCLHGHLPPESGNTRCYLRSTSLEFIVPLIRSNNRLKSFIFRCIKENNWE